MNTTFADAHYYFAMVNANDVAHARAVDATLRLTGRVVTTDWVLTEFGDGMAAIHNRAAFHRAIDQLQADPDVTVIRADATLFDAGLQLYYMRPDKEWSLTDCISFVVMRREGITDALTADRHFEQAGFRALLK